jgi:hypothetical protein
MWPARSATAATFNGIWEAPHGFQLSGLYIFGDNGYSTPTSGFDARSQGSTGGRLRQNGTLDRAQQLQQSPAPSRGHALPAPVRARTA